MPGDNKYSRLGQGARLMVGLARSEAAGVAVEAILAVALIALIAIPGVKSFSHATMKLQCENLVHFQGQGSTTIEARLANGTAGYLQAPGAPDVWACCVRVSGCFFAGHTQWRLFPEDL